MVSELIGAAVTRQAVPSVFTGSNVQGNSEIAVAAATGLKEKVFAADGKNVPVVGQFDSSITSDGVNEAVHKMRDYMQVIDRDLHFSVDEDSGVTVVKVIDPETKEVVRQIPSDDVLRVVRSLEKGGGLLADITA